MGSVSIAMATEFVDDMINRRVKERVFDGRPDKVLRQALIADVADLIERLSAEEKPAAPARKRAGSAKK